MQEPVRVKDFSQCGCAQKCPQRQRHFGPFVCIAANRKDCEPEQGKDGGSDDGQSETLQCATKAQPGGQHGHQLGIAEAHAFLAADKPVGQAYEEDQAGSGEDGEKGISEGVEDVSAGPALLQREEEA